MRRPWGIILEPQSKSPRTIDQYIESLDRFTRYLDTVGVPDDVAAIRREHVEAFIAELEFTVLPVADRANRSRCGERQRRRIAGLCDVAPAFTLQTGVGLR